MEKKWRGMFKKPPSFFLVTALEIILCGIPRRASQYTLMVSSCPIAGPLRDLCQRWPHPSYSLLGWLTAGQEWPSCPPECRGARDHLCSPSLCTFRTHGSTGMAASIYRLTLPPTLKTRGEGSAVGIPRTLLRMGPGRCRAFD